MVLTKTLVAEGVTELVAGAVLVFNTLSFHAAHSEIVGVTIVTWFTLTQRLAIYHLASCIIPTNSRGTWINAFQYSIFSLLTCLVSLA